jgi:hypothetical protein
LEIWAAKPGKNFKAQEGRFISIAEIEAYALPSLMMKVVKLCLQLKTA